MTRFVLSVLVVFLLLVSVSRAQGPTTTPPHTVTPTHTPIRSYDFDSLDRRFFFPILFAAGTPTRNNRTVATKVVAASDSQNTPKADYVCDGTDDQLEIQAAIDALPAGGGKVVLLEGTFTVTAGINMSSTMQLVGSGWATIMDVSGISSGDAVVMGNYSVLRDLKIQGDITPLTAIGRRVRAGNHSLIERIWINENDGGIETRDRTDVHINNVYFTRIHDSNGWASVIHASGSADGIFVDGVYAYDCDRALEVEDGARNFYAKHGYLETIKVPGSYSFVLDVHTHAGQGGVQDVVFEDFYLKDTDGITAQGAGTDISRNITFRNITMISPAVSAGRAAVNIARAEKVTVDGMFMPDLDLGAVIVATGRNILLNDFDVVNAQRSTMLVSGGSQVTLQNSRFKSTEGGYAFDVRGGRTRANPQRSFLRVQE